MPTTKTNPTTIDEYLARATPQAQFHDELKGFTVSKGTIQFTTEKPLPVALVKKIIRARAAENAAKKERAVSSRKNVGRSKL